MLKGNVDTTRFQRDLALYIKNTSKTIIDAINFKLYDAARAAIKGTTKADRNKVKQYLDAASVKYPEKTVAEIIVIMQQEKAGKTFFDLDTLTNKYKNRKYSSLGFTKAGWIPALKKLLKYVGREAVSVSGIVKAAFGGAEPANKVGSQVTGSIFNDVDGTGNKTFVEANKQKGAQAGIDKVSLDMETYLAKKLDVPIDTFNRA